MLPKQNQQKYTTKNICTSQAKIIGGKLIKLKLNPDLKQKKIDV